MMTRNAVKQLVLTLTASTVLLTFFQNCSQVQFAELPSTQKPLEVEALPELPAAALETEHLKSIVINEVINPTAELDILVLVDDSKSNIVNIDNMVKGLEDLVLALKDDKFTLEVYTLFDSRYKLMKSKQTVTGNLTFTEFNIRGTPLARIVGHSNQQQMDLVGKLRTHLDARRNSTATEYDSSPQYVCELLAHFTDRIQAGGQAKRFVAIVATDELSSAETIACTKSHLVEKSPGPTVTSTTIAVEYKRTLEGGGFVWVATTGWLPNTSCDTVTPAVIEDYIRKRSSNTRAAANTSTSCKVVTSGTSTSKTIDVKTYAGLSSGFLDQMNELYKSVPKANFFFGGFIITDASQLNNPDQKIGTSHIQLGAKTFAEYATKFYPLSTPRYSQFVKDVLQFEKTANRNYFDLSELVPASQWPGLQIVSITLTHYDGSIVSLRRLNFTRANERVLITDEDLDLGLGGTLEVKFQVD